MVTPTRISKQHLPAAGTIRRVRQTLLATKIAEGALASGQKITRYNRIFHWAVPPGMEKQAGAEIERHYCMTHCY